MGEIKMMIQDDWAFKGVFAVPKAILDRDLSKAELCLLLVLLKLEHDFLWKSSNQLRGRWIFASNAEVRKFVEISRTTLARVRTSLKKRGLIEYRRGYTHRATSYRIIVDKFYLADDLMLKDEQH